MPSVNRSKKQSPDFFGALPVQDSRGSTKRRWLCTLLAVACMAGGGAWWLMHAATAVVKAEAPPLRVEVVTVRPTNVPIYRSFPGRVQAMRTVSIQARVTGYLAEQTAQDGADVAEGELLYRIDSKDYQAAFRQAEAQLAVANASLRYARVSNGRNQALARDGWVARDLADQTNSTLDQGQASRANNSAALEEAALNLSRTEIRAPFAGRLSASQVFQGSLISVAGATLNTLVQLDPIYVSFNPAEANLAAIMREQTRLPIQTFVTVNGGNADHTGPVSFIDNQVSLSTGTILLRATIENRDHELLPGQFATARLHLGDLSGALPVPQDAVSASQIGQTVLVVGTGNKVEQRIVTLGDSYDGNVVATTGIKPGDRVIIDQLQKLKPGMQVDPSESSGARP
ncbi:MAG: efflux RND transporter periplasmic adaptor subunit [Janthinobacterium lividum]